MFIILKHFPIPKMFLIAVILCQLNIGCSMFLRDRSKQSKTDSTTEANKKISEDEGLKYFDEVCNKIPSMQGYQLDEKTASSTKRKRVSYYYRSLDDSKVNFPNLMEFYTTNLNESGWKDLAESYSSFGAKWVEFKKDDKYILIETVPGSKGIYAITCMGYSYSMVE